MPPVKLPVDFIALMNGIIGYAVKRFWRRVRLILLVVLIIWLLGCGLLAFMIYQTGSINEAEAADVIIVLGAGLTDDGQPNWALSRRSEHAAELWKAGFAEMIICTGGVGTRVTRSEADGCREVLEREGVPGDAIVLEDTSRSTEENAINSKAIMEANGWQTAILVSDSYHVFRASYIFSSVGIDVLLSPVPIEKIESPSFYAYSLVREVLALQWHVFKEFFHLPVTYVRFG
jgi:uncharacterized SAM-binding protein YcdF (DUF218 family)